MPRFSHHYAFIAFTLWLLGSLLGAHGHFCFDGQEPPVSIKMHLLNDHLEHHADEAHQDADVDLLQSTVAKVSNLDWSLILPAVFALLLVLQPKSIFISRYCGLIPTRVSFAQPPLRAPPFTA